MKTYKINFTHQEISLLVKYGHSSYLSFDGEMVSKKTYVTIQSLLNSLKSKEYITTI